MVLKTRTEIRRLAEIMDTTLDADRDGVVSADELEDRYALAADELDDFAIESVQDLRFWTSVYKPGTDVVRAPDGGYVVSDSPMSLRAECLIAYENGQLMDAALQIEGNSQTDIAAATLKLEQLESAWRTFYAKGAARYDRERLKALFAGYCNDAAWEESGRNPREVLGKLNDADLRNLYDGALLVEFLRRQRVTYEESQLSFADFFADGAKKHTGTCTVLTTLALHLFKIVGVGAYRPVILPTHVTLCLETALGPVYLGAGADLGFQPPGYFESRPPAEKIRRTREPLSEPWQVLSTVYTNLGNAHCGHERWEEARRQLEASLEICPENPSALYLLGVTSERLGDPKGATEYYRKVIDLSPGYDLARQALREKRK